MVAQGLNIVVGGILTTLYIIKKFCVFQEIERNPFLDWIILEGSACRRYTVLPSEVVENWAVRYKMFDGISGIACFADFSEILATSHIVGGPCVSSS